MKTIPFLSVNEINDIQNYIRFSNLKAYIKSKTDNFTTTHELVHLSGYANYNKFVEHRKEFDNLYRDVPLKYFKAINVDIDTLLFCTELDMEEYKYVLENVILYPRSVITRLAPCIYQNIKIPSGLSGNEVIPFLLDYSKETKRKLCINYHELKSVWIFPDGLVNTVFYPPEIRITKTMAIIQKYPYAAGTVSIR